MNRQITNATPNEYCFPGCYVISTSRTIWHLNNRRASMAVFLCFDGWAPIWCHNICKNHGDVHRPTLLVRTQHQRFDIRCYWCFYIHALLSYVTSYHYEIIARYKCNIVIPVFKFESNLMIITQVVEWSWERVPCRQNECLSNLYRQHQHQQERSRWVCAIWKTGYGSYISSCMFRVVHPWTSIE